MLVFAGVFCIYLIQMRENTDLEYNRLADSFLSGQLHMNVFLLPEIANDPFNYKKNAVYILPSELYDFSYYKERIYLYFGAVPAIVFYIPWRLLLRVDEIPDYAAVMFFCLGALFFAMVLLVSVQRRYFAGTPKAMVVFASVVLGLANLGPLLTSEPCKYMVAASSGLFFLMGALAFFGTAFEKGPSSSARLFLGSLFMGLAIGCKFHMLISAVTVLGWALWMLGKAGPGTIARRRSAALIVVPCMVCLAGVLLYNYFRFDSIFETGWRYELSLLNQQMSMVPMDTSWVLQNVYLTLFHPPAITGAFPYFDFRFNLRPYFPYDELKLYSGYWPGTPIGLMPGIPYLFMIFFAPVLYWASRQAKPSQWLSTLKLLAGSALWTAGILYGLWFAAAFLKVFNRTPALAEVYYFLLKAGYVIPVTGVFCFVLFGHVLSALHRPGEHGRAGGTPVRFPAAESALLACVIVPTVLFYLFFMCSYFRYRADYATMAILATTFVWFYYDEKSCGDDRARAFLRAWGYLLGTMSAFLGIAYTFFAGWK